MSFIVIEPFTAAAAVFIMFAVAVIVAAVFAVVVAMVLRCQRLEKLGARFERKAQV